MENKFEDPLFNYKTTLPHHEVDKSNLVDLDDEKRNKEKLEEFLKAGEGMENARQKFYEEFDKFNDEIGM